MTSVPALVFVLVATLAQNQSPALRQLLQGVISNQKNEMNRENLTTIRSSTIDVLSVFFLVVGIYLPVSLALKGLSLIYIWHAIISLLVGLILTIPRYKKMRLEHYLIECILQPLSMCSIITFVEILSIGFDNYLLISSAIACFVIMLLYIWLHAKKSL